jgi:hypothetical protein
MKVHIYHKLHYNHTNLSRIIKLAYQCIKKVTERSGIFLMILLMG